MAINKIYYNSEKLIDLSNTNIIPEALEAGFTTLDNKGELITGVYTPPITM